MAASTPAGIQLNWQVQATFPIQKGPILKGNRKHSSLSNSKDKSSDDSDQSEPKRKDAFKLGFQFVNVSHPSEARGKSSKSAIRSHVARVQHSKVHVSTSLSTLTPDKEARARKQAKRKQFDKNTSTEESDGEFKASETPVARPSQVFSTTTEPEQDVVDVSNVVARPRTPPPRDRTVMLQRILQGGRHDPFWTYPVPFHSFLEEVVDHCKSSFSFDPGHCQHTMESSESILLISSSSERLLTLS